MKRLAAFAVVALGACSLEPKFVEPLPAVPATLPYSATADDAALASVSYRDLFRDPRLAVLVERALAANQNLRATLANVEAARALYRVERSARLPSVLAGGDASVRDSGTGSSTSNGTSTGNSGGTRTSFGVDIGVSAFELDLFGRVRSLSNAALNTYLASEAGARAVRLTLVADVADAYLTHATDSSLLVIARDTVVSAQRSVMLTRARLNGGVAPRTDLRQAETVLETARADVAALTATVEQDRNALTLLVGATVTPAEVATDIAAVDPMVVPPPSTLDSTVLLRRPDVVEAEYQLRAANARIGAARAAFFPRISLTGLLGFASNALTGLFSGGAFNYSAGPSVSVPVFDGGANRGNLDAARARFDAALATYQATIQAAFRDVADALARRATIGDQAAAVARLEAAARDSATLTEARYRGGVASFLESLDAQRTLYAARRQLTNARLLRARSSVALYRALGADRLVAQPTP